MIYKNRGALAPSTLFIFEKVINNMKFNDIVEYTTLENYNKLFNELTQDTYLQEDLINIGFDFKKEKNFIMLTNEDHCLVILIHKNQGYYWQFGIVAIRYFGDFIVLQDDNNEYDVCKIKENELIMEWGDWDFYM